jgi:UDP-N-acetylglucosamine--N-acetylmuramyl-(pentapeptide) pyrophosphoryl-undecaprenol N-acetylglucosamine transferase
VSEDFVMLAAGGTGGHLFPAQALAEELGHRGIAVELATDTRGDRYGGGFPARRVHQIASATISGRSPGALAKTGVTLTRGIAAAYKVLGASRPGVVVGFGGYPSFPPVLAARMRGIPTVLHEQNAVLGRANRLLAKRVTAIATSFAQVTMLDGVLAAKARFTGNPVRGAVITAAAIPYVAPMAEGPVRLLVFGGSQGARFFSDSVPEALALLALGLRARLVITQQARAEDVERVRAAYQASGISAEVAPFFADLPQRMATSHLVIGRAGASSIAELAVIGRPSILVPLPHAIDNDQLKNAASLSAAGGAWTIEQAALTPQRLAAELTRLAGDPHALALAAAAAKATGRPDAVARLADLVQELMASKRAAA